MKLARLREFVDRSGLDTRDDYSPCTSFCSVGFGMKCGDQPVLALVSLQKVKLGGGRTGTRLIVQKAMIVPA